MNDPVKVCNKLHHDINEVLEQENKFNPNRWLLDLPHIKERLKGNLAISHGQVRVLAHHVRELVASNRRLRELPERWEEISKQQEVVIAELRRERKQLTRQLLDQFKDKQKEVTDAPA